MHSLMPIFISPINFFLSVLFLSWQTHTHHAHKSSSLLFWIDVFLPVLIFNFYFYYTLCPNMNCKYHRTFIHSLFVFRSFENVSVANDNAMWHEFIMFEFKSLSLSFCKSDWNENLHTHTRYFSFWTEHTHTHTNFLRINNESTLSYMVVVDAIDKQKKQNKSHQSTEKNDSFYVTYFIRYFPISILFLWFWHIISQLCFVKYDIELSK